jgi:beta-lactamase family protein
MRGLNALRARRRGIRGALAGTAAVACVAALALTAVPAVAGSTRGQVPASATVYQICRSWRGHAKIAARMSASIRAVLASRESLVALRVDDPYMGIGCWLRGHRHFDSASVVKATILAALLRKAHVQHRSLTSSEQTLAWRMITESDNDAATALWDDVGMYSLQRFLDKAGMDQTILGQNGYWGLTQITAHDEMLLLRLLLHASTVLTRAARHYELYLMAHVIASQRWGVPAGVPSSFNVHVKNGWLPTPPSYDWWINSIGCFTYKDRNYSIVILTWHNPNMTYGVNTVEDVAEVINHDLNPGAEPVIPRSTPFPSWGTPDERIPPALPAR